MPQAISTSPIFVSTLRQLIDERIGSSLPVSDLLAQLRGWVRANDLRRDELEWSGLESWCAHLLEEKPDARVWKNEVQGFLDANDLVLRDVWNDHDWEKNGIIFALDHQVGEVNAELHRVLESQGFDQQDVRQAMIDAMADGTDGLGDLNLTGMNELIATLRNRREQKRIAKSESGEGFPDYSRHVLPGGRNYRELLLTFQAGDASPASRVNYRGSSHWSEANVIAHVRFSERIESDDILAKQPVYNLPAFLPASGGQALKTLDGWDIPADLRDAIQVKRPDDFVVAYVNSHSAGQADAGGQSVLLDIPIRSRLVASKMQGASMMYLLYRGDVQEKRILFIEEIQSDWAQDKRRTGEPSGPYVSRTKDWVMLCLKRMIRYAADRGYDAIAWTNGEQQVHRFWEQGGRERIAFLKAKSVGGKYAVEYVVRKGEHDIDSRQFVGNWEKLQKHFGVEVAVQVDAQLSRYATERSGMHSGVWRNLIRMSGAVKTFHRAPAVLADADGFIEVPRVAGLRIGNAGLRAFYDEMLPNIASDLVRKLGGHGLMEIQLPTGEDIPTRQVGFEMTGEMKRRALSGLPRYHRAWHGTAKQFESFDTKYIGTGEGNQAFGWGLYFASDREVAEWYRKRHTVSIMVMPDGKRLRAGDNVRELYPAAEEPWQSVVEDVLRHGASEHALRHAVRMQYEAMRFGAFGARLKRARQLFRTWKQLQTAPISFDEENNGLLYEVELATDIAQYLDWFAPIGSQSEVVRNALSAASLISGNGDAELTGQQLYERLSAQLGSPQMASEHLKQHGLAGIRYLDGNSRQDGEIEHYNFVVFDEGNTEIKARYSRKAVGDHSAFADVSKAKIARETAYYGYPDGRSRGFVTRMAVADFLELSTRDGAAEKQLGLVAGEFDPERFDAKDSFLPYLDIDPATGVVVSHEGRHRAAALLASGAVDMPVVLTVRQPRQTLDITLLKGEFGRGAAVVGRCAPLVSGKEAEALAVANGQQPEAIQARVRFYSALRAAIDETAQAKASPGQWRGLLKNLTQKGVRQAEIEWSGIIDWLDLKNDEFITKDQVLEYLKQNGVQVHEVVKGADNGGYSIRETVNRAGEPAFEVVYQNEEGDFQREGPIRATRNDAEIALRKLNPRTKTKYGRPDLVLPGGENYRELLLTLPPPAAIDYEKAAEFGYTREMIDTIPLLRANLAERFGSKDPAFKSSHWDEPNIIAHIRFNERIDVDGARVLFIEEIQSDWGQAGKKQGFSDSLKKVRHDELRAKWLANTLTEEEGEEFDSLGEQYTASGIPAAPFVTDTKAWLALGIKRMIAYAVENGFDKVAFVNGAQSAARYDLSKQVDTIYVDHGVGGYRVWARKNRETVIEKDDLSTNELRDTIGKELADKAIAHIELRGTTAKYEGDNLKVGGEGMKTFYDKIIPQVVRDVLKKVGGGSMENLAIQLPSNVSERDLGAFIIDQHIDTPVDGEVTLYRRMPNGETQTIGVMLRDEAYAYTENPDNHTGQTIIQLGFSITPAMRAKLLAEGMPLFKRDGMVMNGMTANQLRAEIDNVFGYEFSRNLIDSGVFRIVSSEGQLPAHLRHPDGGISGVYDDITDKTYLVADQVSPEMVRELLLHEVGVHYGFNKLLGDRAPALFQQARDMLDAGEPSALAAYRKLPPDTHPSLINEEILAYMVGDLANLNVPLVQRVWSRVKGFLFEKGADIAMTPTDMLVMAEGCLKRCAADGKKSVFSFAKDVAYQVKRAFGLANYPFPQRLRDSAGRPRYAYLGQRAQTADESRLQQAVAMSALLTVEERARYNELEDRFDRLSAQELAEYERLSLRVDVQFDPDLVRQQTGWFRGYDNRWRFEIDDSKSKLLMPYSVWSEKVVAHFGEPMPYREAAGVSHYPRFRLDEVLEHPALFEAYPKLREVRVFYDYSLGAIGGTRGYYNDQNGPMGEIGIGAWLDDETAVSVLAHELQHVIQRIEGFARGGSTEEFADRSNAVDIFEKAEETIADIKARRPDLFAAWDAVQKHKSSLADKYGIALVDKDMKPDVQAERSLFRQLGPQERGEHDRLMGIYAKLLDGSEDAKRFSDALVNKHYAVLNQHGVGGVLHRSARNQYESLAGEIEARDVQARWRMPMESDGQGPSRQSARPYASQCISAEDVIVKFGRGMVESAEAIAHVDHVNGLERAYALALQSGPVWKSECLLSELTDAYLTHPQTVGRRTPNGIALLLPPHGSFSLSKVVWLGRAGEANRELICVRYRDAVSAFWKSVCPEPDIQFSPSGVLCPVPELDADEAFDSAVEHENNTNTINAI